MKNVAILGKEEKIMFSVKDYYGANIKLDLFDDDNGVYLVNGVPLQEIVSPVVSLDITLDGLHASGVKLIQLVDASGVIASERFIIDGEIYRVTKVDLGNNTITVHRGLISDVVDLTIGSRVGNMGTYKTKIVFGVTGTFVIQASDTKYGIHKSESLVVRERSLEEMFQRTKEEIDMNEQLIKDSSSFIITM